MLKFKFEIITLVKTTKLAFVVDNSWLFEEWRYVGFVEFDFWIMVAVTVIFRSIMHLN